MIDRRDITGVILCGGDARRMHGVEKVLEPLLGLPLVQHVRSRLAPQVATIVIAANRERDRYAAWGDFVIPDDTPGLGPLGGLVSAMRHVRTPFTFCCPGDAPRLHASLVARLATALDAHDADIGLPHDGARAQHLFLLVRTSLRDALAEYLAEGGRSAHGWVSTQRTHVVDASDIADSFLNINTETDLANAALTDVRAPRVTVSAEHHHEVERL